MSVLEEMRHQAIAELNKATGETVVGHVVDAVDALHDAAREIAQDELAKAAGRFELDAMNDDERRFWDAAATMPHRLHLSVDERVAFANRMVEERRKRWGRR